jgi:hypothetical protein
MDAAGASVSIFLPARVVHVIRRRTMSSASVVRSVALLLLLLLQSSMAPPADASLGGALSPFQTLTLQGGRASVVAQGVSGRDGTPDTSATLTLETLPAGAVIEHAWLYWQTTTAPDPDLVFAGTPVTGTQIGSASECSRPAFTFRADVTALVPGGGDYVVTGFASTDVTNALDTDGVALVVIWRVPTYADESTFVLHDGLLAGNDAMQVVMSGFTVPQNQIVADLVMLSDVKPSDVRVNAPEREVLTDTTPSGSSRFRASRYPIKSALDPGETTLTVSSDHGASCFLQSMLLLRLTHAVCVPDTPPQSGLAPPLPPVHDGLRGLLAETIRGGGVQSVGAGFAGRRQNGSRVPVSERTLVVDAVPPGATIRHAWLFWNTYGIEDDAVTLAGTPVQGTKIGTAPDTCWPINANNHTYRADVRGIVDGNGSFVVTGLPSASIPLDATEPDSQGVSLVVVWQDPAGATDATVIISEGAAYDLKGVSEVQQDFAISTVPATPTSARLHLIVGDGQSVYPDGQVRANGSLIPEPPSGHFRSNEGTYWDDHVLDVAPYMAAGDTRFAWRHSADIDCMVFVATIFQYTTPHDSGAGPTCGGAAVTTTTTVATTTTTSTTVAPGATTTTTTAAPGATTTTTLPAVAEICGNCIDDDGDGRVDLDDPDCCVGAPLTLKRARLKPSRARPGTTTLRLAGSLADPGAAAVDPGRQDVVLQLHHRDEAFDWCARIPASAITAKKGVRFRFRDRTGALASGVDGFVLRRKKNGTLKIALRGKGAQFATPSAGAMGVVLGFDDPAGGRHCASIEPAFRPKGKKGLLLAP